MALLDLIFQRRLGVLDDAFPHALSGHRISELTQIIQAIPGAMVFSSAQAFSQYREMRTLGAVIAECEQKFPGTKGKIKQFDERKMPKLHAAYMIYLNNAVHFLPYCEQNGIPFAFALYPGGGFLLNQKESDEKLKRVLSSPLFRKVIVTQKAAWDYLRAKQLCPDNKIAMIYGAVFQSDLFTQRAASKQVYGLNKSVFDVCFVAQKTVVGGADKGFDIFAQTAELLAKHSRKFRFHVTGNFNITDLPAGISNSGITFYGSQPSEFFPTFYNKMDAILSPAPAASSPPGSFDPFPLDTCVEAGLSRTAVFCTDPLRQNMALRPNVDLVGVPRAPEEIKGLMQDYADKPERFRALIDQGGASFSRIFGLAAQMKPRIELLSALLEKG